MDAREQQGMEIAATARLKQKGSLWLVPSQSSNGDTYSVELNGGAPHCTCPVAHNRLTRLPPT